jgi:hypothetical protein
MKLNIEIELTKKELDYILLTSKHSKEYPTLHVDDIAYKLMKGRSLKTRDSLIKKDILVYLEEYNSCYTTYLYEQIAKQLSK